MINNQSDTLFADISEFQVPATRAYTDAGYRVLSIRSNDGTHLDGNFGDNYQFCVSEIAAGRMDFFLCYYYWRPDTGVSNHISQVQAVGGPHPQMVSMMDVESGGNPGGDQSDALNSDYDQLASWLGDPLRVIGYLNRGDFTNMWKTRPPGLKLIGAGYGADPQLPGQIVHQYTDGGGYGGGLPEGAPPFGNCDMNSCDGLSVGAFAEAVGLAPSVAPAPPTPGLPALPTDDSIYIACTALATQFVGAL